MSCAEDKGSLEDIPGFNGVTYIDNGCSWVDGEDYPFHGGHISIARAEVGSQGYHWSHVSFYL